MSTTATDGTVEITMTHAVTGEAASSWKHKAGRREGPEHYRFGDLTKTLVHKVAGPAEPAPDDRSPELAVTSVKCRVRVPWAQRLWDDAPLCRKLRELGLGRAEAGGAVEVDARTFGASLSERDAITCLRHADGVNGSLSKRPPLAMPRYCGSLDACDALRGAFDACFGAGSFDGAEKQWADAPLGARLALALARDEARRAVASSVAADVLGALRGEAALCGAAFFAFLADGERGDDFRELRYDRDAKSVDAVGRFRFRFRPGTPALDVLSHHETGARSRRDVADALRDSGARVAWLDVRSASGAARPAALVTVPRGAPLPARDVIATLAAADGRDDYDVVSAAVDDFETARALEPDAADRVRAKLLVADVSTLRRLARDVARRKGDERVARALALFAAPAAAAAGKG
ncbi:hypothetical protein AURANDRAFT_61195 [Aureococcus anophagefferens]|uniref:Uncharacterized protein n=1 Tax=Aureococcus anophagefferens TaxID=44056 RepID=F0XXE5_AURAN|nr:hypothetical protein AURANDRAFT_61195 [Aureococcus anophagefferens]EGB12360.1 hypothetical protein AURANDRAFT_61195 [Aureococcus anophagefferens]|eukprot:XP_009033401.1 hypothetical protein AURANDRAFT_61195 [Aureococcus anophagefferens]